MKIIHFLFFLVFFSVKKIEKLDIGKNKTKKKIRFNKHLHIFTSNKKNNRLKNKLITLLISFLGPLSVAYEFVYKVFFPELHFFDHHFRRWPYRLRNHIPHKEVFPKLYFDSKCLEKSRYGLFIS